MTAAASAKAIFLVMVTGSSSASMSLDTVTETRSSSWATAPASASRRSGYPRSPTARQNRTTLVADVPQEPASSEMLRQATPAGSSSTAWATRCSTGARLGSSERMVMRMPGSGPGGASGPGPDGRAFCRPVPASSAVITHPPASFTPRLAIPAKLRSR